MIYSILYKLHDWEIFKPDWINTMRSILNDSGFSGIWLFQTIPISVDCLRHNLKIRLIDQFMQKWHEGISQNRICTNYRIFNKYIRLWEIPNWTSWRFTQIFNKIQVPKSPFTYWDRMPWKCTTGDQYMSTLSKRHWRWIPLFIMLSPI